ncbi:hypothetical protein [Yoonia algicola]|uniref:Phosphatase n=1 Tax=Yoonia algicola TaxID=3137368 RepID=A0AAN0LZ38_9RHOB
MIKGIIFDKDGTLFDFNATWGAWTRGMLEAETGHDPVLFARLADALGYDVPTATFRPESMVIASTAGELAEKIKSVLPDLDTDALLARMNAAAAAVTQVEAVPLQSYFANLRHVGLRLGIATNDAEAPRGRIWSEQVSPSISILSQAMTAGTAANLRRDSCWPFAPKQVWTQITA